MQQVLALVAAAWLLATGAPLTSAGAPPTKEEAKKAFTIFLNVKEDIVHRCIYKPAEREIVAGALKGLARELGPELASHFPPLAPGTFAEAWRTYQQTLQDLAALPQMKPRLQELVEQSLRAYCRSLDRYCDYDDLASWERETELKRADYIGVGMSIERTPEGHDCYPFPGGPADLAGCDAADRLIEVDGQPVRGRSIVDTAALIVGKRGTTVKLKVRHKDDGKEELLTVSREEIRTSPIEVEQGRNGASVRLRRLNEATVQDLGNFLRALGPGKDLTLDLRGCHGGDFSAAVAIASMFLPRGAVVARLETLAGKETFKSENASPYRAGRLTILQDRATMSGAELVTVALVTSRDVRAQSIGEKSYGKGVTIAEVAVEGGGRLRITDARLYGPHDEIWDQEGLSPTMEGEKPAK